MSFWRNQLIYIFFLLGLGIFAGRAGQAGSLYWFGFFIPVGLGFNLLRGTTFPFSKFGWACIAAYLMFPLSDLIQVLVSSPDLTQHNITFRKIFTRSQFSSALGLSGISMLIISRFKNLSLSPTENKIKIFEMFTAGVFIGSLVLSIYVLIQFFTGFNFTDYASYRPDRTMGRFYRVVGFTNHPVSFANVSLIVFTFYWRLLLANSFGSILKVRFLKFSLSIVVIHGVFILLSGSRMAILVAAFMFIYVGWVSLDFSAKKKLIFSSVVAVIGAALLYLSGVYLRFIEVFQGGAASGLGDRKYFWKVHYQIFLDSPIFGQGHLILKKIIRPEYYEKLGFGALQAKYNAHNLYLETLADVGILGFALLSIIFVFLYKMLKKSIQCRSDSILVSCFLFSVLSGLLFGLTQNSFFDTPPQIVLMSFLWMIIWFNSASSENLIK